jgi:hypothetical protein
MISSNNNQTLRLHKNPPKHPGGAASATPPKQFITAAPPGTPRAGASTFPSPHCTVPMKEAMVKPYNPPIIVAHKQTLPMDQAKVAPTFHLPSQNLFKELANDAAGRGDTDDDVTVLDDGLSQSLLDSGMPSDDPAPQLALAVDDVPTGPVLHDIGTPAAASPDGAAATIDATDDANDPTVQANFNAHNCAMSMAITEVSATL